MFVLSRLSPEDVGYDAQNGTNSKSVNSDSDADPLVSNRIKFFFWWSVKFGFISFVPLNVYCYILMFKETMLSNSQISKILNSLSSILQRTLLSLYKTKFAYSAMKMLRDGPNLQRRRIIARKVAEFPRMFRYCDQGKWWISLFWKIILTTDIKCLRVIGLKKVAKFGATVIWLSFAFQINGSSNFFFVKFWPYFLNTTFFYDLKFEIHPSIWIKSFLYLFTVKYAHASSRSCQLLQSTE